MTLIRSGTDGAAIDERRAPQAPSGQAAGGRAGRGASRRGAAPRAPRPTAEAERSARQDAPLPLWLALGGLGASAAFTTLAAGSQAELEMTALLTAAAAAGGLGLFGLFERAVARRDRAARRRGALDPALETAPEPIALVDRYGRVLALNRAARAAFASAGGAEGRRPPRRAAELLPGRADPAAEVYRLMREALEGRPVSQRVEGRFAAPGAASPAAGDAASAPAGEPSGAILDVWAAGEGQAVWRWRSEAAQSGPIGGDAVAWCRIEPSNRISEMSPLFARWLAGGPTDGAWPSFLAVAPDAARRAPPALGDSQGASPGAVTTRFVGGPAAPRTVAMLVAPDPSRAGSIAIAAPSLATDAAEAPSLDDAAEVADALEALDGARLFDDAPIGVLVLSPSGRILRLNGPADRLLTNDGAADRVTAGPLGDHLIDWLHADDRETAGVRLRSAARGLAGGGPAFEARLANDGGESRVAECHFTRIDTARGRLLLGFLIDASEQRELQRNFVQAQRLQAVGELAGGVAHDFNNLLLVISGYCETLLASLTEDDPAYGDLCLIHQSAERAKRLVKQLLAFSRRQTLTPTLANLSDETGEVSSMLNRLLGEKIELRKELADDVWPVRVDVGQFGQVLTNLLVNARDAMAEGGVITVRTANERVDLEREGPTFSMPPGEYVRLDVMDTGCGIPKDKQARIFQPFYTTKGVGEGTGLGLSMVYGIIKQTGGYIFVDSQVGEGTSFSIFLPRCLDAKRQSPGPAEAGAMALPAPAAASPTAVSAPPDVVGTAASARRRPRRRAGGEIGPRGAEVDPTTSASAPAEPAPTDAGPAEAEASAPRRAAASPKRGSSAKRGAASKSGSGSKRAAAAKRPPAATTPEAGDDPFAAAADLLAASRAASPAPSSPPSPQPSPPPSIGAAPAAGRAPEAKPPARTATASAAPSGARTVLLVEDETAVRALAARFLRSRGYEVLEADCGEDALEILEDEGQRIDLMLSDVIMPNMDGPSVLRRLGPRRPELRTIFMSGYARDAFAEMLEQSDAADGDGAHLLNRRFGFLAKPFALAELAEAVAQALSSPPQEGGGFETKGADQAGAGTN